ncbi:MAG: tRNA uridine-5-carboxymethylaminomethyl(34) synthesis GTPase MnmE [Candidatus Phytoplasma stylosanthis]|uniref:tRNA uridine-5-carboxymethylaminomethyl(34) synthesis GTPase MnmE n=1 Tax=Candidatus Phytoplasma stylosanthis TaxID=2798314 RepID=UPI00293A5532|nr:tRNA uridine-5-carboxymethylaminomethyl(34) synthesis GTPase MnmE [Candidatus Phytoplasma stylosanthis]MDV3167808.1 tRNA uridine-5-carboxymethylaminomethyl(34) synthesis GTPase MnmE [Candidatus Phytoplasma stylosanthis]MDV3170915.1 tRNA uridine-5-carboxymethylaminomethyl(34) synthesis GTPase MnmE [Candidatus Phytoplasma stylosanthis]MDV3174095.1 tRNA uridine-5-carboxymethylaminomethyl(34) synthesis GTPase MnmE [Candidatus Phytoplasma stylosanthis]MDV3202393.1 tRNA uridine-5-carboxymethylamin
MFQNDTIAAIATPLGNGSISVIRISGPDAIKEINKIFSNKKKDLNKVNGHTIHHGFILDEKKNILDEVLISVFKKPHSFTGEDIIEIQGHGGILITQILLERILSLNIRLAQPGEFSKRAFLNNKIDLIQAESIMDLIFAQNKNAIKLANSGLHKKTSKSIENINKQILELIAQIEVNIDYPEYEDITEMTNEIILPKTQKIIEQIKKILKFSIQNKFFKKGLQTLIIGKPNVGKSSLLNILLKEKRAIVSDIAGTTRDYVDGHVNIKGVDLFLIDTAGIRKTKNIIEKIGIDNTKKLIKKAELILLLLDQSHNLDEDDRILLELTKKQPRIIITSKADLPQKINLSNIKEKTINVSHKTYKGIEELKENILKKFNLDSIQNENFNYLSNARHIKQMKISLKALQNIISDIEKKISIDIHTINLKEAFDALNNILGKNSPDILINELFSKFCLGK